MYPYTARVLGGYELQLTPAALEDAREIEELALF